MRAKDIMAKVPVPSAVVKLVWQRLTLNRTITLYISISFLLAFVQIPLQIAVLDINEDARELLGELLETAEIPELEHVSVLTSNPLPNSNVTGTRLEVCEAQSADEGLDDCIIVWADGGVLQPDGTYGDGTDSDDESDDEEEEEDDDDDDDDNKRVRFAARSDRQSRRSTTRRSAGKLTFDSPDVIKCTMAIGDAAIKRAEPVPLRRRDSIVATPIFDTGIPAANHTVGGTEDEDHEETDAQEITRVAGLTISDPAQDGSLMLISTPEDAFTKGVFGMVKVVDQEAVANGGNTTVAVSVIDGPTALQQATVPRACVLSLLYPSSVLYDAKREDIALVAFHVWLLALHIVGILNESVVYILVSIGGLFVAVGWSVGVIVRSTHFRGDFERLIARGACGGVDILPNWFRQRITLEVPILVTNLLAFIVLAYLSGTLVRVYNWNTSRRLGARQAVAKMYKTLILFSVSLQLAAFFVAITVILWLDQLHVAAVVAHSSHKPIYQGTAIPILILTVPWLVLGWLSVRREHKHCTHLFLAITALFLLFFSSMLTRASYRFTIKAWSFFAFVSSSAMLFSLLVLVFGIWCRINFDKGLKEALIEMAIKEDADTTIWDFRYIRTDNESQVRINSMDEKSDTYSGIARTRSMKTLSMYTDAKSLMTEPIMIPPAPAWIPQVEKDPGKAKRGPIPSIARIINPFVLPGKYESAEVIGNDNLAAPAVTHLPDSRSPSPLSSGSTRGVGLPSSIRPHRV